MHFSSVVALFAGLAAAAPSVESRAEKPSSVKVHSVKLLGTGCPKKSADVTIDATGTLFEATFSEYIVQTGPGTKAADWRKNCKLTLNMEFESGFQFTVMETKMKGFAQIPSGAKGVCKNTFSFTGGASQDVDYEVKLNGKREGDFSLSTSPGIFSWSPCGGSTAILNMNTQCSLSPTHLPALIAVDSVSGALKVIFQVQWQKCKRN